MIRGHRSPMRMVLSAGVILAVTSMSAYSQSSPQPHPKPDVDAAKAADPNADLMRNCADLLKGMGLKIASTDKNIISFISKRDQYNLIASDDGSLLYLTVWWNIPKEKAHLIPVSDLMQWNSIHATYFGMQKNGDGSTGVVMSENFPSEHIDVGTLRGKIDQIEQDSDVENSLLDHAHWK